MNFDPPRTLAGIALAAGIALLAYRARALSKSGAGAAAVLGTACTAAGWSWASLLVAFFASAVALSRIGGPVKRARLFDVVDKSGGRDAAQVLANGSVFAVLAITSLISHSDWSPAAAAAALAASTADTWATEVGALSSSKPRSILSMKVVPTGTSGGITLLGLAASLAGAAFIALLAALAGWRAEAVCAAMAGGFGGSLIDSVMGAALQERRWCTTCDRGTERAVHHCGTRTIHAGGFRWIDNDAVNFLSSVGGAALGLICLI